MNVGEKERLAQNRVVDLFINQLGYEYLGNWEEREGNSNIEQDLLSAYLSKQGYNQTLINKALYVLMQEAGNQSRDLYYNNKAVYSLLRYGAHVKEDAGENNKPVNFIDWKNPKNNHFAIAEEVTVKGVHDKRPDIVLYINGIAVAVLELKRSTISISEGIRQNIDNQKGIFIKQFFTTVQLVMAGSDTAGVRYGSVGTEEKYYLTWKEEHKEENQLHKHLIQLCSKEMLLELIHDFTVHDSGRIKLSRPNQYFAVKASQERIRRREGGIIWHTQGSGKSLIMIWLAKWIHENVRDSRVLIITDREELDTQIETVFRGVEENIYKTKSGRDLLEKLNLSYPWLLCSLIHKFGRHEETEYDEYIEELKKSLPKDFRAKGDIYVFVDECHRTQSGALHEAMKEILPNALFIGFTGTPLLKKDKKKSIEVFGSYIHTYKFDEAVRDKVVVDLCYEARDIEQNITSQQKIDEWFDCKTKGLNDFQKTMLKQKWGTMKKVLSSKSRLEKIVYDIMLDMASKSRLMDGSGNALLVSGSIYQACKFYELFQQTELAGKCAIVTSYKPYIADIKGEGVSDNAITEKIKQYEIYMKMLNGKDVEDFEAEVKKKFVKEPALMKLLIVVDKLLTGFDAPSATYLYIDKKMQDHGLFQAICRVNRLDGEDKEYGFIIDYKDLFKSLENSIADYTSEAFDAYDKEDVEGLLNNRLKIGKERLDTSLEAMRALCEPVESPKKPLDYQHYFCGDPQNRDDLKKNEAKRMALYKQVTSLVRAFANIANEMVEAGYSQQEADSIKAEVAYYVDIRDEIKVSSNEKLDLKAYEPDMRFLIDAYIKAEDSRVISTFEKKSLVELIIDSGIVDAIKRLPQRIQNSRASVAETIENNIRRLIIDEMATNPKYYEKMSVLLDEIIKERKEEVIAYEEYLKKIAGIAGRAKNPSTSAKYPSNINTGAKRALYDNLGEDAELVERLDYEIKITKKDSWRGDKLKEREVKYAIAKHIEDAETAERIFELVNNQKEY